MTESEEKQIAKIEDSILETVFSAGRLDVHALREKLSGFSNPRKAGRHKLTKEDVMWLIGRLTREGLLKKQRRFLWIPVNSRTIVKLGELGLIDTRPVSLAKMEMD
jgi:predicted transcriptional regulator